MMLSFRQCCVVLTDGEFPYLHQLLLRESRDPDIEPVVFKDDLGMPNLPL